jgi:hypothetical protein
MSTFSKVFLTILALVVASFFKAISGSLGFIGFALFFGAMALIWKKSDEKK